jgi:hypothetical protein
LDGADALNFSHLEEEGGGREEKEVGEDVERRGEKIDGRARVGRTVEKEEKREER